jgi:hypothetical protein
VKEGKEEKKNDFSEMQYSRDKTHADRIGYDRI